MKKIKVIVIVLIMVVISMVAIHTFLISKGFSSRDKYKHTDEYMALLAVNKYLICAGEVKLSKGIKKLPEYTISKNKVVNLYICNQNNNIVVITLPSYTNCMENSILGVALNKDFINSYSENGKGEDITYPVLRGRKDYGVHITVKSKNLVIPGDIYKGGKVISTYTKDEREKLIKFLKKEAARS